MSRSIQQLPNNSGTTSVTEVYTSTGFSAGDPVYFQNGDYKSPANLTAPSSVNFSFANNAAINPLGIGGIVAPSFTYAQMQAGVSGGTPRRFASVLTNGNIVQAWSMYSQAPTNPNTVYFRVVDPSGTVVVAPTLVSATFTSANYASVSVVALAGGGFAIGWLNDSGGTAFSANYAIYNNSGVVVTAATQDTSFAAGNNYFPLEMTSLANGGFAIAVKNSSSVISLRAYSSTGVGAYATINTGITASLAQNSFALTSRSDSSVFVCDRTNSTTYTYAIFNTGGTAIVSATGFTIPSGVSSGTGELAGPDASVLTDGTTIVIGFNSHNGTYGYPAFRFLPTSNTISAQTIAIPVSNLFYQTTYNGGYLSVQAVSGGNFILYFSDGYGNMQYAFYNSSGTCISGSNGAGAIPLQITGGFSGMSNRITLLESSGFIYAYWTSTTYTQKPVQQVFCKISTSTYIVAPFVSLAGSPYTVSGQPAGASIPSTVNPNSLSFYSTASSTTVATNTPATISGPTGVGSSSIGIASCTLPNGNFVVAWQLTSSPYTVSATVFSPTGSPITTVNLGASVATTHCVKVAALSGGGFVVAHASTGSAILLSVFSSGYSLATSVTITSINIGVAYTPDVAGLQDNKFAVIYSIDGTNANVRVYNSALTALQNIPINSATAQGLSITGNSWGGFAYSFFGASFGSGRGISYVPTGTDAWTLVTTNSLSAFGAYNENPQMVATESGLYLVTTYQSSYPCYHAFVDSGNALVPYTAALSTNWPNGLGSTSNPTSYPMMGIGMTGNGNVVIATSYQGTNLGLACIPPQLTFSTGQPLPYKTSTNSNVPMFSNNAYNTGVVYDIQSQPRVTSGLGNNAIITFLAAGQIPSFMFINGTSVSNVYSVVAGVTPSALTPIAPATTSGVISGVFAGVAITSATAGSTGQLANNGQVLLGASYTSTATGAFDSTGAAVSGVKGTFNGRSVNLQGNS
jgi:hypothetical protein